MKVVDVVHLRVLAETVEEYVEVFRRVLVLGMYHLNFRVANVAQNCPVEVAFITEYCILGSDFLRGNSGVIDLQEGVLKIKKIKLSS